MRYSGNNWKYVIGISLLVLLFIASCTLPFLGVIETNESNIGSTSETRVQSPGKTQLEVNLGIGALGARTVIPDPVDPTDMNYEIILTPDGQDPIVVNLTSGQESYTFTNLTPGNYEVLARGFVPDGLDPSFSSFPIPILLEAGVTTAVSLELNPLQFGNKGGLVYSLSWPFDLVDNFEVFWGPYEPGQPLPTGNPNFEYSMSTLDGVSTLDINVPVNEESTINAGNYLLRVNLLKNGIDTPVARLNRIVRIYDSLTSRAADDISADRISQPPTAPENMIVQITGGTVLNIFWNDTSITETGFIVAAGSGAELEEIEVLQANAESLLEVSTSPIGFPGEQITISVVAFNDFGESESLEFSFRLPDQLPSFVNSDFTNDPSWAAQSDPGSINWSTPIEGGADELEIYLVQDGSMLDDVRFLTSPVASGLLSPPYKINSLPVTLEAGESYSWRFAAVKGQGRVVYPAQVFTIRQGLIVDGTGSSDAAGSILNPLASIQEAINLAEDGETILIQEGTYDQSVLIPNNKNIQLQGASRENVILRNTTGRRTVELRNGEIRDLTIFVGTSSETTELQSREAIAITQGTGVTVENVIIREDSSIIGYSYGIHVAGGLSHIIRNNQISMASTATGSSRFQEAIRMGGLGTGVGTVVSGNKINMHSANTITSRGVIFSDRGDFYNNIVVMTGEPGAGSGLQVLFGINASGGSNSRIVNNTFINMVETAGGQFGDMRLLWNNGGTNVVFANNIVVGTNTTENILSTEGGASFTDFSHNMYFKVPEGEDWVSSKNIQTYAASNVLLNPWLEMLEPIDSNNWFAPSNESPQTLTSGGSSAYSTLVTNDILGNPRPGAGSISIGPYQVPDNAMASTNIYVSNTIGSDLNLGTLNSPFATLSKAVSFIEPGGTIHISQGLYEEALHLSKSFNILGSYIEDDFVTRDTENPSTILQVIGGTNVTVLTNANNVTSLIDGLVLRAGQAVSNTYSANITGTGIDITLRNTVIETTPDTESGINITPIRYAASGTLNIENSDIRVGGRAFDGTSYKAISGIWVLNTAGLNLNLDGVHFSTTGYPGAEDSGFVHGTLLEFITIQNGTGARNIHIQNSEFIGGVIAQTTGTFNTAITSSNTPELNLIVENSIFYELDIANDDSRTRTILSLGAGGGLKTAEITGNQFITREDMNRRGNWDWISIRNTPDVVITRNKFMVPPRTQSGASYAINLGEGNGLVVPEKIPNISNNIIEFIGDTSSLWSYGISLRSKANVINNTLVYSNSHSGNATRGTWVLSEAAGSIIANNIFASYSATENIGALTVAPSTAVGLWSNAFHGTTDNIGNYNVGVPGGDAIQGAGNVELDPVLLTSLEIDSPQWYSVHESNSPDFILSGGSKSYLDIAGEDVNGAVRSPEEFVTLGAYQINGVSLYGAQGPAGGYIFYMHPQYTIDGWRYLEAAPENVGGDNSFYPWAETAVIIPEPTGTAIGDGLVNTNIIVQALEEEELYDQAAQVAAEYEYGSGGWFLPSIDELSELYQKLSPILTFPTDGGSVYWSSSEYDATDARGINFFTGMSSIGTKSIPYRVRPVRRF